MGPELRAIRVEKPAPVLSKFLVSLAKNRYSAPCEFAGHMASTRLYPTRVKIVAVEQLVADHEWASGESQTRYDWQHYIPLVQRKPGALRNGAPSPTCPRPCSGCAPRCCARAAAIGQ